MPVCRSDFSGKALAAPPGARIALAQRERRLKLNTNHTISKQIVATHPHAFIGLEDLTHIRERTKRRKHRRKGDAAGAGLGQSQESQSACQPVGLC